MDNERWQKIEEVFQTVAECEPAEREAYLTRACAGDEELRREVESLLAHEVFDTFIQHPIKGAARSLSVVSEHDLIGSQLGPYRVTELVGQGGMGAVYAAVRDDELFKQKVAIKVVRRGMDSGFVLNRFQAERRILASLDHPNIARLVDGGSTADGRPYFVMEFIEGQPLNEYCAANYLSIADRIKLFRQVCGAVQYAHQKLIAHRDIKPSNILVNREGAPKLLDFGIAKLLDPAQMEGDPARTATMMRMMTPDYASPEQVRGLQISTATDIYSLGAVLYELLTGERPHRLSNYTPTEIERVICETEIVRPSEAASKADLLPAKQQRQLTGDLDNIILMAMRKEPERRYQSAEQFSDDLRRHLEKLPVIARADTIRYRASKFVRRHKAGVAATAIVIVSLLGGLVATNYQARRAERRFQQVRKLANTFLFDFHDKIQPLPGSTEAREMVVKTAREYLDSLAQESGNDSALQLELAQAYLKVGDVQGDSAAANLGHPEAALESYRKALALARKLAPGDENNIQALRLLATCYYKLGHLQSEMGDPAKGIQMLRQSQDMEEKVYARSGENQQDMKLLVRIYERVGDAEMKDRDAVAALQTYRRALPLVERLAVLAPGHLTQYGLSQVHARIGDALAFRADLASTMESYSKSLTIREKIVSQNPANATYRRELMMDYNWMGDCSGGLVFFNVGDKAAALRYYQKALEISEALATADPKDTRAQMDLAISYGKVGDMLSEFEPAQGVEHYRKAMVIILGLLEIQPTQFSYQRRKAMYLRSQATPLHKLGDHEGAIRSLRQSLELIQKLAAERPDNVQAQGDLHITLNQLGDELLEKQNFDSAGEHYRQALESAESYLATHPTDLYALWRLANSHASLGRFHAKLGAVQNRPTAERIASWREARSWHQKGIDVWDRWNQQAVSSVFNTTRRAQAVRDVAECDLAIAQLTSTHH